MIINHLLIDLISKTHRLDVPDDLEAWLLAGYGWEPCDGLYDYSDLCEILEHSCRQYWDGGLDVTVPDETSLWKDRAETAKYMLNAVQMENRHVIDENIRFMELLRNNGIDY